MTHQIFVQRQVGVKSCFSHLLALYTLLDCSCLSSSQCFHLGSFATLVFHQLSVVWLPLMPVSRQQLLSKCASVLGSFLGRWQMPKELWVRRRLSRPRHTSRTHLQKQCRLRQQRPTHLLPTSLLQQRHPKRYRRKWNPSFRSHSHARYLSVDTGLLISSRRGRTRREL